MSSYHYFGNEGESIPEDVEELVVHPLVPQISERACECFQWLTRVNFSGSVLSTIGKAAFNGCVCLLEIEIPRSVTTVGTEAFMTCQSLTTVRFHQDGGLLTTIGSWAFADCSSLAEVSIPSSVETIG
ncbi:unnamed protein product [Cylindrotheca closterium]|uniref:Leucine-rich repeat domain-containing protein n=1 Tax=Cylindrotheca closterium TaxID=2856 RepID=A0AAD2JMV8_9STRA|nr:unnamed protein product [Cylindrotheca closterium]